MPNNRHMYTDAESANSILAQFGPYAQLWASLPEDLVEDLLSTAARQIDTLPCLFPKACADQQGRYPVICNGFSCGLQEAAYATVLQAVHLAVNAEYLAPEAASQIPSQTVCFEDSAECIEFALGALVVLESYLDLCALS